MSSNTTQPLSPGDLAALRSARYSGWSAAGANLAAAGSIIVALVIGNNSIQAARDESVRAERAVAYSAYLGSLSQFNEFIWANLHWAGTDRVEPQDMEARYYKPALELQAQLDANHAKAMIYAIGSGPEDELRQLKEDQNEVFQNFKCKAEVQKSPCGKVKPAGNADIEKTLSDWSHKTSQTREILQKKASEQIS